MKVHFGAIYLTPEDASEILGISLSQVYRYIHQGKLTPFNYSGCTTLSKSEILKLKAERETR